jgi:16S rRNA (guanine527-N7)-methyltransferase
MINEREIPVDDVCLLLTEGLVMLGQKATLTQIEACVYYLDLLKKWGKAYNLTASGSLSEMAVTHVLDSVTAAPFVQGEVALDVGTGAGLPGVILAILQPEVSWVLLDANSKKIRFVRQCQLELGLENVTAIHGRAEAYSSQANTVVSRAVWTLADMVAHCHQALLPDGVMLAMKGRADMVAQERLNLSTAYAVQSTSVQVPFLDSERHIVTITKGRLSPNPE